ncbi:MAG: P-type conjugative transfer ATPase TrbB [Sphingomonadales bacterium]|nr:P-type conjugative transfer ATPase TrbB [Sphingomonadales bacterium]
MTPSETRTIAMLKTALGPAISAALREPTVTDVLVNPDGQLWVERSTAGLIDTGVVIAPADVERIIRVVAGHLRLEANDNHPVVSAELPGSGERFEGLLPPVVVAPTLAIRKPAGEVFALGDYVTARIMTERQALLLREAVQRRRNILIVGGTGSGKTTLANALLREMADASDRIVLLEDTRELQCSARNAVALRTKDGVATLADLVRSTLRLRPDRIVVGEVRGAEALDMLKAWNTGHPGGIATLHANSARAGLYRLEQLIQETVVNVPQALIAEAVDLIVFLKGRGEARRLETLARVTGLKAGDYRVEEIDPHVPLSL